jgi:hypothetical protein
MKISKNVQKKKIKKIEKTKKSVNSRERVWKMFFDGASSCEGEGTGVLFVEPRDEHVFPSHIDYSGRLIIQIMSVSIKLYS